MTAQLSIKQRYFFPQQLVSINWDNIPKHIAMIPDGNRRWAMQQELSTKEGHEEGGNTLIEIVKAACELNIEVMTFYLFSTENWARPELEITALMWLLHVFLLDNLETMLDYGIKLHTIGTLEKLPEYVQETIRQTKIATENCQTIDMVLAINYGSRDEMCRAVRSIAKEVDIGMISPEDISESLIASHLDTAPWKDPDLLIRTSGEKRLSNYLLWQLSYSEIHVTDVLWPNFRPNDLLEALLNYQTRHRRLGKQ
ncbi:MAG: di-trans,poly-cis-decaprenylcistransferase [Parachlamydiaceae bacterium]|nr:di-trans,poly-cis-decaprenylcistransferase [Parachlamydiaceae bacterium]